MLAGVVEGVIVTQRPKGQFIPKGKIVLEGNPARKLSSRDRARLLRVLNATREGRAHFVVELTYDKQTDADPRRNGPDFQAPAGVSLKSHIGLLVKAEKSKEGHFYVTIKDSLRTNQGQIGFTSMRLEGIRSFKIVTETPGPLGA
jgi:hypothetical protein